MEIYIMRKPDVEVRNKFFEALKLIESDVITVSDINQICEQQKIKYPQWFTKEKNNRAGRGLYKNPNYEINKNEANVIAMAPAQVIPMTKKQISNVVTDIETTDIIPKVYTNYVPFGNFDDVYKIVSSGIFYPILITGHSGNGKTMSVEQACAKAKRKFICISMTPDTDEGDLLGNYVLINGEMVWRDGPVTVAARIGAVLCIDEIDYGGQNLSVLQRVLEGKSFLLKKKNELITPAPGFTIVATANTKGKGSDDGRYMFTNILNEAFLERFLNTMEQEWPEPKIEKKILKKEIESYGKPDDDFAEKLVNWADVIRKTFDEGGSDEVISTRRLVHIAKTYGVFGDKMKSIQLCLNRFDEDTKSSFLDLYSKIDSDVSTTVSDVVPNPGSVLI
jgi:hypothetical protein